jgi:protocatechuate 3,4-dioxygenase beta subunit
LASTGATFLGVSKLDRRKLLQGAFVALVPVACNADSGASSASATTGPTAGAGGPNAMCALTPQQTKGPFYLAAELSRELISEDRPGVPLAVRLRVVQLPDCRAVVGARVDIWHADHLGRYSGFPEQGDSRTVDTTGETFLRGSRVSDAEGRVRFTTVYPGWYGERAVHMHFKVHLPGNMEVASQMYFPEAINAAVHQTAPYLDHGPVTTSNGQDGIFSATDGRETLLADVTPDGNGYLAQLVVGIA